MLGRESKAELELKLEVRSPDCDNEDELWADTEELRACLSCSGEGPFRVSSLGSRQFTPPDGVLQQVHSPVEAL